VGFPKANDALDHLPKSWREEEGCVAFHGLELTYVFGAVPLGLQSPTTLFLARTGGCSSEVPETDELDFTVADNATTIWAEFARTGNPAVEGLAEWPPYTELNNRYIDIGGHLVVRTGIEGAYVRPTASLLFLVLQSTVQLEHSRPTMACLSTRIPPLPRVIKVES
jgi:hypothetical protein